MIEYITAANGLLQIFKGIKGELPKQQADKAEASIKKAEEALKNTEAEVAKALGFKLCKCTFPPQIMLWKEQEKTNVCPSCGSKNPPRHDNSNLKPAGRFGGVT